MDKPAIKKFAIWARNKLIADTKYRAGLVGVTETTVAEPLPQSNETVQFFDVGLPQPYRIEGDAVTQRQRFVAELNKETAKQGSYTAAYQACMHVCFQKQPCQQKGLLSAPCGFPRWYGSTATENA